MKYLNDKQIIHIYRFYKRKKIICGLFLHFKSEKGAFIGLRHDELGQSFETEHLDKMTNCAVVRDAKRPWTTKTM